MTLHDLYEIACDDQSHLIHDDLSLFSVRLEKGWRID